MIHLSEKSRILVPVFGTASPTMSLFVRNRSVHYTAHTLNYLCEVLDIMMRHRPFQERSLIARPILISELAHATSCLI